MESGSTDPFDKPRLPSGHHGLSKEFVAGSQRERIFEAAVDTIAEQGYPATTVNAVIKRAGVSSSTFYSFFAGKEECFLAAHKWLLAELLISVGERFNSIDGDWPQRMSGGLAVVVEMLAKRPERARVMMVELLAAGPAASDQYLNATRGFPEFLSEGRKLAEDPGSIPPDTEQITIGAVSGLVFHEVLERHAEDLNRLLPTLVYVTLVPFLGHERALAEMNRSVPA